MRRKAGGQASIGIAKLTEAPTPRANEGIDVDGKDDWGGEGAGRQTAHWISRGCEL